MSIKSNPSLSILYKIIFNLASGEAVGRQVWTGRGQEAPRERKVKIWRDQARMPICHPPHSGSDTSDLAFDV